MKGQIAIIILLILNTLTVFIPMDIVGGNPSGGTITGDSIYWENSYARLEVYPHTSSEIIRQRQWANLTWKTASNTIDVAFRFDDELYYGRIWYYNGISWTQVTMEHTTYNGKHYYYTGFDVVQDTIYRFKWEYDTPINHKGKWDFIAKLTSDSIQTALDTGRYVCLDPWWDSSWGSRMTVTIPSSLVGDTVTNFPLLLNFSGNTDVTDNIQTDGWDIRFVASDNSTEYYYHFADSWSTYHKVWVKIPSIAEDTDTVFNMYFDNAGAGQSAYLSSDDVWSANYVAVYYMNSSTDFSGNGYDLTNSGVTFTTSRVGSIGKAGYFDGTDYMGTSEDSIVSTVMEASGGAIMMMIQDTGELGSWSCPYVFNNTGVSESRYILFRNYDDEVNPGVETFGVHGSAAIWGESWEGLLSGMAPMPSMDLISMQTGTIGGVSDKRVGWCSVNSDTWTTNTTLVSANHPASTTGLFTIGAASSRSSQYFKGYIDTVIIMNQPLTEHEMYLWTFNLKGMSLIDYGPRINLVVHMNSSTDVTDTSAVLNGYLNSSNQNEINCGFIYGRVSPVSNSNLDGNVTCYDLYNATNSFEYNISSLIPADVYYVKAWGNDSDDRYLYSNESSFLTHPGNASCFEVSGIENGIHLEWVHGTGYDKSILLNRTGTYPAHPTNGTVIYNGTNTNFDHTCLSNNTNYYYSLWEWSSDSGFSEHSLGNQTSAMLYHNFQVDVNSSTDVNEFNVTLNGWFTGDSLSGDYTCGFWYGTSYPLTEDSKVGNVSAKIDSQHTNFSYNLTGLLDGKFYYVKSWISNASAWETSSHGNFTTNTSEPTGLSVVVNDDRSVSLSWSKTYTSPATTVVVRKLDSYPSDWSDGTIIYNSTGTSYEDTNDSLAGSHWYYRVWGHVNPFSINYSEDNVQVIPFQPGNVTTTILTNSTFDILWDNGTGARTTVVRRKLDGYPSGVTDGTEIYNGTSERINVQDMETSYYYSLWSYANETYSSSVNITIGGIVLYCFDEDTNESLEFDIFISNENGSQTHEQRNISNGYILNVSQLPLGDDVKFVVSASQNYSDKSEDFSYGIDENQTITYIILSYSPKDKPSTNVTCINESTGGKSYPPFTLDGDLVTILPDDADNFTKVFVNYTYSNYHSRTYYRDIFSSSFYLLNAFLPPSNLADLYLLEVVDQYDEPLEDAYIQVKNKVNNSYVVVSSLLTDANGQANLYLIEFDNYIFVISKDGYVTENASWTPGDLIFTHTFKLKQETGIEELPELGETISLRGVIYDDDTLVVTFKDNADGMIDSHFEVFEYYNQTFSYMGEYNGTTSNSISFTVDIVNTSRMHVIVLYMNHTSLGSVVGYIVYVNPIPEERDEGNWLERLIENSGAGEWEYGWVITFAWYLPCIMLLAGFGAIGQPGIGILGAGMWSGWITFYLVMPEEAVILTFSGIALIIAFLVVALKQGKKLVNE